MNDHIRYLFVGAIAVVATLGLSLWWLVPTSVGSKIDTAIAPVSDHTKGGEAARLELVEYSDFQCPACGAYYPLVKQIMKEFGGDVRLAYRHFSLRQIHQNADLAARVAEAAGVQGKFWEMHDTLFERQAEWSKSIDATTLFAKYAGDLGLDWERFRRDISSQAVREKVESDYQKGLSLKVDSTPTFFLNGEKLENPRSYEEFRTIITQSIQTYESNN